jgi:hypothetical protein
MYDMSQMQQWLYLMNQMKGQRREGGGISGWDSEQGEPHGSPQYQAQIAQQAALAQAQSPENLMKELAYRQAKQDHENKQAGRDMIKAGMDRWGKTSGITNGNLLSPNNADSTSAGALIELGRAMAGYPPMPVGGGGGGKGGGGNAQGQLEQTQAGARAEDAKRRAEEKYYNDMISGGGWAGNPNTNQTLLGVYPQDYTPYNPDTYDQVGDYPGGGSGNSWTPPPEMEGW